MEAKKTLFSPARPMEATAAPGSSSSWRMSSAVSSVPSPLEVGGVADLDLVVVDPQIDQVRGLAADDHLVVAGVLELRGPEAAHHGEREQLGLGRDGRDDRAVAAGGRCAGQEARAEDEQVLFIERSDLGRDPIPQQPRVGAQSPEVQLGQVRVRRHALDASPAEVDLQVESRLCVPHGSLRLLSLGAA